MTIAVPILTALARALKRSALEDMQRIAEGWDPTGLLPTVRSSHQKKTREILTFSERNRRRMIFASRLLGL